MTSGALHRVRRRRLAIASNWTSILRYWNVVRPAWPVPAFSLATCALLLLSSQGKEALYVVTDPREPIFVATLILLVASTIVQYGIFLVAACGYYASFSDRAMQGAKVRIYSAAIAALITPTFLTVFTVLSRWGAEESSAMVSWLVVWAVMVLAAVVFARRRIRLVVSPFSAIVRVSSVFRWVIFLLLAAGFVFAVLTLLLPSSARWAGPVGLTLVGLTLWSAFWTGVVILFERWKWPPTALVAMTLAVVTSVLGPAADAIPDWRWLPEFSMRFDRNLVDLPNSRSEETESADGLRDVDAYARDWLCQGGNCPGERRAIIVIAEGGGIRAAVQTASLLTALADRDPEFFNDTFVLSGVSGGAVGIADFLARRPDASVPGPPPRDARAADHLPLLAADHLSPTLAALYFWDWPVSFAPLPSRLEVNGIRLLDYDLYDRGSAFETSLQSDSIGTGDCRGMRCAFLDVVEASSPGRVAPVVLLNTTRTSDGAGEVISNIVFPSDRAARLCNVLERLPDVRSLSMATAAHLSARFPGVSPPGALRSGEGCSSGEDFTVRYVDGGYLDNSGASSARIALAALRRVAAEPDVDVRLRVVIVHIFTQTPAQPARQNDFLPELTAPLDAVVNARTLQGLSPIINLCRDAETIAAERVIAEAADVGTIAATPGAGATQSSLTESDCESRVRERSYRPETAVRPSIEENYSVRVSPAEPPFWIGAPLWTSSGEDVTDPRFVPLGWVLSNRSYCYVETEMERVGEQIGALLGQSTDRAPVNCGRAQSSTRNRAMGCACPNRAAAQSKSE